MADEYVTELQVSDRDRSRFAADIQQAIVGWQALVRMRREGLRGSCIAMLGAWLNGR
ncbi:hypothetical protein ACVLD2_001927 [Paenibacillus sp. PvR052]|nr:hypothetical protein [Paenibacillus sp. PvP091]MBP1170444.1 hypothetical protein [Paenibacillus sp. PvR098]MBP2441472.1 hypothetical protein [Paenibacillus sp. PvP052]